MMKRRGIKGICCYLDDFILICDSQSDCQHALQMLLTLLTSLGFEINWSKLVPPAQQLVYLGVQISSLDQPTISLPANKVSELKGLINEVQVGKSMTKKALQSLIGKLSFAAKLVKACRPYVRKLIDLCNSVKQPSHHVRLSADIRLDLQFWFRFLSSVKFNGVTFIIRDRSLPDHTLFTDSCVSAGAAFHQESGDWVFSNWEADTPFVSPQHINLKELWAIRLAILRWWPFLCNSKVVVYTDSSVALAWINKLSAKNRLALHWLRDINMCAAKGNFYISAKRISSQNNILADALSRMEDLTYAEVAYSYFLDNYGIDIANHKYPLLAHMTVQSFLSILQGWHKDSGSACRKN
jgi:hypothetical protein